MTTATQTDGLSKTYYGSPRAWFAFGPNYQQIEVTVVVSDEDARYCADDPIVANRRDFVAVSHTAEDASLELHVSCARQKLIVKFQPSDELVRQVTAIALQIARNVRREVFFDAASMPISLDDFLPPLAQFLYNQAVEMPAQEQYFLNQRNRNR